MQKVGAKANTEVKQVEANPIREKRKLMYVNREKYLLRKTDDLDRGVISVTEFLCSAYQDNPDLFPLPEEEGEGIVDHGNLEVSLGTYFILLINNSNQKHKIFSRIYQLVRFMRCLKSSLKLLM